MTRNFILHDACYTVFNVAIAAKPRRNNLLTYSLALACIGLHSLALACIHLHSLAFACIACTACTACVANIAFSKGIKMSCIGSGNWSDSNEHGVVALTVFRVSVNSLVRCTIL